MLAYGPPQSGRCSLASSRSHVWQAVTWREESDDTSANRAKAGAGFSLRWDIGVAVATVRPEAHGSDSEENKPEQELVDPEPVQPLWRCDLVPRERPRRCWHLRKLAENHRTCARASKRLWCVQFP